MPGKTSIEWTTHNLNPVRGCSRVSEGCRNCYAETLAARFSDEGNWGEGLAEFVARPDGKHEARWTGKVMAAPDHVLTQPLHWKTPRMIFVNSTSDLFHEDLPDDVIDRVFAVMALCPQHTFQILTKRPERMRAYFAFGPWLRWLEHMKPLWHGRWASEVSENGGLPTAGASAGGSQLRGPCRANGGCGMNWYARQRQAWIGEMLFVYGYINRRHLVAKFGCSVIQASHDLTAHARANPDTCTYDPRRKAYVNPKQCEAS